MNRRSKIREIIRVVVACLGPFLFWLSGCSRQSDHAMNTPPDSRFRPGQVWAFKTPADQPDARLTILLVESRAPTGTIVHVAVSGLTLPTGGSTIQHMPFTEDAIARSVTTLLESSGPIPDFAEGYLRWKQDKGGVFTTTVAEGLDAIVSAVKKPPIDAR